MNPIVVALACVAALCACRSPSQGAVECRDEVHLSRACRPRPAAHATESPPPATPATALDVGVDPRFEILSVVFRLAEFREYSECLLPDYAAAVDAHFGPFRDHPAVRTARALRKRVGYDAIPNLALRVKDAQGFEPLRPLEDSALGLDGRWDPVVTAAFLKEVAAFAKAIEEALEQYMGRPIATTAPRPRHGHDAQLEHGAEAPRPARRGLTAAPVARVAGGAVAPPISARDRAPSDAWW